MSNTNGDVVLAHPLMGRRVAMSTSRKDSGRAAVVWVRDLAAKLTLK